VVGNSNTIELRLQVKDDGSVVIKKFTGEGVKDLEKLEKSSVSITSKMGAGLQQLRQHWLAYTAAIAGAVYIVQGIAKASIKAASDLEEVQGKFSVVFRDQMDLAGKWADTLREGYLMSRREARQYLSSMQDLLVPMGMNSKEAGRLSFEIVKLAADLGSFNHLPTAQVMADIQSALVGNYETVKKYGVVLNATTVEQRALATGIAKSADELTTAQKAQMAYNIILESSASAIGAVTRDYNKFANQQKLLNANMEDLRANLGEMLLPATTQLVKQFNEWYRANEGLLQQKIPEYADRLTTALEKVEGVASKVGKFLVSIGVGETLFETKADELHRKIKELEEELARLESWQPNIVNRIFGNTDKDIRRITEINAQLATLRAALQALNAPAGTTNKPTTGPATPPGPDINALLKQLELEEERKKALAAYENLYARATARIEELSLEEKDFKVWQLDEWYRKAVEIYNKAGKDTSDLVRLYGLEQDAINEEFRKKQEEEHQKQAEEHQKSIDEWMTLEHAITSDLATEVNKRMLNVEWEYEARLKQIEHLKDVGTLSEQAYTQAVADAVAARDKLLKEAEKQHKDFDDYIRAMNEQTAQNMQQSLSDLFFNTMKGNFNSFEDWFNSFCDSIFKIWSDTLSKMASEWLLQQMGTLGKPNSGESGQGWGNILTNLIGGLLGLGGGGGNMGVTGGSIGGFVTTARGAAFRDGWLIPFASGAIVTGPTIFPMAEGYGLMGEKGYEAVMPLARTPQGDLGVKATAGAGGKQIVLNGPFMVVNTPNADSFRKTEGQIMAEAALALNRWQRNL
jgi:hypothetical protein